MTCGVQSRHAMGRQLAEAYKITRPLQLDAMSPPAALRAGGVLTVPPLDPVSQTQPGPAQGFLPLSYGSFPHLPAPGSASPPLVPAPSAPSAAVHCHLHSSALRSPNSVCQGHRWSMLTRGSLLLCLPEWHSSWVAAKQSHSINSCKIQSCSQALALEALTCSSDTHFQ